MKISSGIDITNIKRKEFCEKNISQKILTTNDLKKYNNMNEMEKISFLAKNWALKEAIFKSYNHKYSMNKIEILYDGGKMYTIVDGVYISLSISYEDDYVVAVATCIIN